MTASSTEQSGGPPTKRERWDLRVKWIAFLGSVAVSLVGLWLLWFVSHREPVAAPFTRVGGATNVETAVDASRFWLTSPRFVVETSATASPQTMLAAAQCAMVHDAPLLFTGMNPEQERLVKGTISDWANPVKFNFKSQDDLARCLKRGKPTDLNGLSTLAVARPVVRLPGTLPNIPTRQTLAPSVVFAAPLTPRFLPDVAVGMALGAHMATAKNPVSLVVVPRYLEADPELEKQLESQRELVSGGVTLGQPITVPDDTRALLRQLLTPIDRHDFLAQIKSTLELAGPVTAALLALLGAGTASLAGLKLILAIQIVNEKRERAPRASGPPGTLRPPIGTRQLLRVQGFIMRVFSSGGSTDQKATSAGSYWRSALGENQEVTVWLRSGTTIAGVVQSWHPSGTGQGSDRAGVPGNAVLRLERAALTPGGGRTDTVQCEFVLLPVADIELIAKISRSPA